MYVHGASTNCGLRDQGVALRWVRENATEFGGDPDRVTVFGQCAGGMSVALLLASPHAEGLFRAALIESGSGPEALPAAAAHQLGEGTARALRVAWALETLRAVDQRPLLKAALTAPREHSGPWDMLATAPWVDDDVVPTDPLHALLDRPVGPPSGAPTGTRATSSSSRPTRWRPPRRSRPGPPRGPSTPTSNRPSGSCGTVPVSTSLA